MIKNHNKLKCSKAQTSKSSSYSNEELELSLEVEIDDEVKEIIKSPQRCASALLDVTIIRPEDVEQLYSIHKKTLKGKEVKKFINAMNLSKNDVKKMMENMLEASSGISAGDHKRNVGYDSQINKRNVNNRIRNLLLEDDLFSEDNISRKTTDKVNQIYTTPKTFHTLNSIFQCKNKKGSNDKPDVPCVCENCAIVGVVTDSQKKPFATESTYDPQEPRIRKESLKKRKVSYSLDEHHECQHYFRYLSAKIKSLEARLCAQEDKAVPKDYFKKIITKLMAHITKVTNPSQVNIAGPSKRSRDTRYREYSTDDHSYENFKQRIQTRAFVVSPNEMKTFNRPSSKKTTSSINDTQVWKWGEEVLRPGIDIKNKIVQLLDETMKNLRGPKPTSDKSAMKDMVNDISQNLYKTIHDIPEKEEACYRKRETLRKKSSKGGSSVDISYINPSHWDESQVSLIVGSENGSLITKPVEYCK